MDSHLRGKRMETSIKELIFKNCFYEAYEILEKMDEDSKFNIIVSISCDTTDIRIVGFVFFLIQKNASYGNYKIMVNVLHQMCWLDGAYHLAYFYATEMYKMAGRVEDKKALLFYWQVPEKPIPDDLALKLAKEVLIVDSSCSIAKEIVEKLLD